MIKNANKHEILGKLANLTDEALLELNIVRFCDWKEMPMTVLEDIDDLLKPFDLEIVVYTAESDDYEFSIMPIKDQNDNS